VTLSALSSTASTACRHTDIRVSSKVTVVTRSQANYRKGRQSFSISDRPTGLRMRSGSPCAGWGGCPPIPPGLEMPRHQDPSHNGYHTFASFIHFVESAPGLRAR
jgi:hypothetical protein